MELFKHQLEALEFTENRQSVGLFMDMGTGKTITAIKIMEQKNVKKVIIVCPVVVMQSWENEINQFSDIKYDILQLSGTIKDRILKLKNTKSNIIITNYEVVKQKELLKELLKFKADMVIADESHRIKNHTSKQSKALHQLGKKAKFKLALTGTPIGKNCLDLFSQYKFLDTDIFGTSFPKFRSRYAIMGGYENRVPISFINQDELQERMKYIAFRVTKEEALDLPEKTDVYHYFTLEPKAKKIYDDMVKKTIVELNNNNVIVAANILVKILKLQQITSGFITDASGNSMDISSAKLKALHDILVDIDDKVVIFTKFKQEIIYIKGLLKKLNMDHVIVDGSVSKEEKDEAISRFQNCQNCKVCIVQIQSGSAGVTLTTANKVIFYSLDHNFTNYAQAKDRIHRIGQRYNCTYIHIICQQSIEEKILDSLRHKKDISDGLINNWKTILSEE